MYEAHLWCGLAESTDDVDRGGLVAAIGELQERIARVTWPSVVIDLRPINGQWFMTAACSTNSRRAEAAFLDELLQHVARRLPGSWGLAYDRDDEMPEPAGGNSFRVRVLARGSVLEAADPFLSPVRPVIED